MDELMQNNPNFADQMNEWQQKRSEKGEDPQDWGEFRNHLMRIGAPDPGFLRPDEFSAFVDRSGNAKMEGAMAAGEAAGETDASQGRPEHQTGS